MSTPTNNLLDYYASIRASGLHARGQVATNKLLALLAIKPGEVVLEIGTGTGTTLVQTAVKYPQCDLHGLEISSAMFKATEQRLKLCGVKAVTLHTSFEALLPRSMDVVYCESVLAIQEDEQLEKMVAAIQRVLKPSGRLVINETIWLDSTSTATIRSINQQCKQAFGIIQANATHPYVHNWLALMERYHLRQHVVLKVDALMKEKQVPSFHLVLLKSRLYSLLGKLKHYFLPAYRRRYQVFQQSIQHLDTPEGKTMEGVLCVFQCFLSEGH